MSTPIPFTVAEAARILGRSEDTTRRWFDDGKLTGFRTSGGVRLFDRASVETLARALAVEALKPTSLYRARQERGRP